MRALVRKFAFDESGATSIEYALIGSGIGLAIVVAVNAIGTTLAESYSIIAAAFK